MSVMGFLMVATPDRRMEHLTSMMSISPLFGQLGPYIQLCTHVSHVPLCDVMPQLQSATVTDSQCGPASTDARWHVSQVQDEEPVSVRSTALDSHTVAARRSDAGGVYSHVHLAILNFVQARALGN